MRLNCLKYITSKIQISINPLDGERINGEIELIKIMIKYLYN